METNTPVPLDPTNDSAHLRELVQLDDSETAKLRTPEDDEYRLVGGDNPKVLITTGHHQSQQLLKFVKELKRGVPDGLILQHQLFGPMREIVQLNDSETAILRTPVDDEYRLAGGENPKGSSQLLTTSRSNC